jgi:SAM-dependent methyltransferase
MLIYTLPFQRDQVWEVFPWPCVGQFRFVDLSLSRKASYARILAALTGPTGSSRFLDVGCCFAQDLRKLVHDGANSANLYGLEKQAEFIDLAFDFFGDRDSFQGKFIAADIFDRENEIIKAVQEDGGFNFVQLGMILHIWDMEGQIKACERVVELLAPKPGSLIVGQSVGHITGIETPGKSGKIFKQSAETFKTMWEEVGRRTGTRWEVRAEIDAGLGIGEKKRAWDDPDTRRLNFEVERL